MRELVYGFLEGGNLSKFDIKDDNGRFPIFSKVGDVIQDPREVWNIGSALQELSDVKQINWTNIDRAPELLELHSVHVSERKRELDSKLNEIVEIDKQIKDLGGIKS